VARKGRAGVSKNNGFLGSPGGGLSDQKEHSQVLVKPIAAAHIGAIQRKRKK
jgi:hypothetical protein